MSSQSSHSQAAQPSFSSEDFAKALEQHDYQFQSGQVVRGKAHSYESNGAYIDVGGKSLAFLPIEEASLRYASPTLAEIFPLQEEQEFLIIRDQDADGQVTLSRKRLEIQEVWERLSEVHASGQSVTVRVTGLNKGGVTVDVQGVRGFIPRSHLSERDNLEALKGQVLTASFLEVDSQRGKLVLSQRLASRAASMSQLERGQLIEGKIVNLKPFGAFIEFNGTTGLLHINQISKSYISDIGTLFQLGQPIKAVIIDLDEGKGRISLSTKVLEGFPGEMVEQMSVVMEEAEARLQKAAKTVEQGE
ncbi:MAG: S1 RNA-binding domain-containing protein [Leptolyngbyaceae bacterium]|nr:S1 RNA-binding domain-containing protein [Leptolyngbyaceae bacterium]